MTDNPFMTMKNIDKSFNGVPVLKNVSLKVEKGEIHALLGENGAGKSTLMNILGGVHLPDNGSVYIDGEQVKMLNPRISQEQGISFIHQELNVVADLKVYENMFLGSEIRNKVGFLKVEEMCRETHDVMATLGVDIDPKEYVRNLDTSYKQLIEIAKALLRKSRLIIMDEPTTSLAEHEVNRLFELMRSLKQSGVSIIYISHKLKEIKTVCDSYTVLRDGELVGTGSMERENPETITKLMVGKAISQERYVHENPFGPVIMEVKNLTSEGLFNDINFTLQQGEILGFTGLAGDGRTELFESLFGYRKKYSGEVRINGELVKIDHPRKALKAGIGFVPKNRKENAIIKDLSVIHNMSLSSMGNFESSGFLRDNLEKERFQYYKDALNIKVHNPQITIDKLSGGNQQKVVIAKWLEANTDILIFDNPTQGIDVGAKQEIYQEIVTLSEQGKAVIVLSSEAPEIIKICHSINVMYQGEITARFDGKSANEEEIMQYATGSKREAKKIG
ncbi:sugar ABC transporter ATP-binding protein [Planococcus halotolerans]|uniref:Autoinducer 2 import ATP-binding protein LsrA n=1 Tax=Planococcus halotolerans TaxID=2233542 RepID=A0A365KXQ3_9BACL|nr:sugar ABC transporter ATP-binding protein [Planococcus halotolerans]QHJ72074.1 ATP-binding cassette domain-containing protein [Planococcus halotolerans]RAZ77910.1 sugar ABC transporter ATP-binding protein [Planococcus halotolerans]